MLKIKENMKMHVEKRNMAVNDLLKSKFYLPKESSRMNF